jgi:hypothetical protein
LSGGWRTTSKGSQSSILKGQKSIEADELAKAATRKLTSQLDVFFQTIEDPSIKTIEPEPKMVNII